MSDFNKEMLKCWNNFQTNPTMTEEIENQFIWCNTNITTPSGNTLLYPRLIKVEIWYIKDIIENGKIMQISQIKNRNLNMLERMELASLITCIPK
jgi:hypothetical protein